MTMEGLPSGDIQAKYQKLASEYSKLRVHVKVLKKGVLDEQAKSNELREALKDKEKSLRKGELEIESLTFRNQQLTRRVSVLQDELDSFQSKLTKKTKGKLDEKAATSTGSFVPLDSGILQEELQKKILENAEISSQLSDKIFEISQMRYSLDDYQKTISESDCKYKAEIARLKNKNHELQFALEELQKDRHGGTPNRGHLLPSGSQATSCNGDFLSEAGSLIGSEDALSSVDELNLNEQFSGKILHLEKENEKLKMEYELLRMENESLKLEIGKYVAAAQKRRSDGHDSGDFNNFHQASFDGDGRVTGLLGTLEVPFVLSEEIQLREDRIKTYFRNKITELKAERERLDSKCEHYIKECETLRIRFEDMALEKETDEHTIEEKHKTISKLEEELSSTSRHYEEQMSVLSEHVASLHERLARQHEEIDVLNQQRSSRRK